MASIYPSTSLRTSLQWYVHNMSYRRHGQERDNVHVVAAGSVTRCHGDRRISVGTRHNI